MTDLRVTFGSDDNPELLETMQMKAKDQGTVSPAQFEEWLYEYMTLFKQDFDANHRDISA